MIKSNNVCCVYTIYALFLYIVNSSDDEIDTTYYILDTAIPAGYESRLKNCWRYVPPRGLTGKWWIDWILFRWHVYRNLPRLHRKTKVFMQDHKSWTAVYVGSHKYIYLEDSPRHISYVWNSSKPNWYTEILHWNRLKICQYLYGATYFESYAHHPNAYSLLLTEDDDVCFLKKRKRIFSLPLSVDTWNSFSDYKRKRIMEIFDVSETDLNFFTGAETMIVTQPLWPDFISREVHADIYKKLLSLYDESKVIIKTHPRDVFDYATLFPNAKIFSKPLPLQILIMMGLNIKTAATIFSTAVVQLPDNVVVDWYGTEFDDRLFQKVGHFLEPEGIIRKV